MNTPQSAIQTDRFPPQIKYIVGNEACERFSYYGMRSILVIYMVQYLMLAENHAESVYHYFVSAAYFTPLLGALISDKYWGKFKTIMIFSLIYCLGHAVLALLEGRVSGLYAGLGLIAIGTGAIKACVSAHVGDQFDRRTEHLLSKVYGWFYFSINFGSAVSTILIPWLLKHHGAAIAFGVPGILMGIATLVFWLGRGQYIVVPPTREAGFWPMLGESLRAWPKRAPGTGFWDAARRRFGDERVEGARAAIGAARVFALVTVFWALYDQQASSWILQAEKMDRVVFGYEILSSQVQTLNAVLILLMIPLFDYGIYPLAARALGKPVTPLGKMTIGMLITASSFACMTLFETWIQGGDRPSILWHILPYVFLTAGEVLVSISGLEFAYTQAPRAMKSTIMSFYLLAISLGNLLTGIVSQLNHFTGVGYFAFFTGLMVVASVLFVFLVRGVDAKRYIEESAR